MPDLDKHRAFVLVGPTAIGKTTVAQWMAERHGGSILSADSMLVYRDMDVGTAKPGPDLRATVRYAGLDLVTPDMDFNVGDYLRMAREALASTSTQDRIIAVGGTGLYIKCLMEGMDEMPAADPDLRERAQKLLDEGGLAALQNELRKTDAGRYESLKDKNNPRRLIRALELAVKNAAPRRAWGTPVDTVVGLRMPMDRLAERIRDRVQAMYEGGLLEEVQALRERYPNLSKTALQAIGYLEAGAVLDGDFARDQAVERTLIRTRQLAKRQMTWLRNQLKVDWIDVLPEMKVETIAGEVEKRWESHGPSNLAI